MGHHVLSECDPGKELYIPFIKRLLYLTWKIGLFKLGLTCGRMRLDGLRVTVRKWQKVFYYKSVLSRHLSPGCHTQPMDTGF